MTISLEALNRTGISTLMMRLILVTCLPVLLPLSGWCQSTPTSKAMSIDLKSSWAGNEWLQEQEPAGRITHELRGKFLLAPRITVSSTVTSLSDALQEDGERLQRSYYSLASEVTLTRALSWNMESSLVAAGGRAERSPSNLNKTSIKYKLTDKLSFSIGRSEHDEMSPFLALNEHKKILSHGGSASYDMGPRKVELSGREIGDNVTGGEVYRASLSGKSEAVEQASTVRSTSEYCPSGVATSSLFGPQPTSGRCGPERYSYKLEVGKTTRREGGDRKEVVGSIMRPLSRTGVAKVDLGTVSEDGKGTQVVSGWLQYFF